MIVAFLALALTGQPQVSGVIRDPVRVYDQAGASLGTRPQASFKGLLPLKIEKFNDRQQPGVEIGGTLIFLKPADIETSNVSGACMAAPTPTRATGVSMAASNVGAGAGLASQSARCVSAK